MRRFLMYGNALIVCSIIVVGCGSDGLTSPTAVPTGTVATTTTTTTPTSGTTTTTPSTPAPVISSFTCNAKSVSCEIPFKFSTNIHWSVNTGTCEIPAGPWSGTFGNMDTGSLSATKVYTLTCTNAGGSTSSTVTVNVKPSTGGPQLFFDSVPPLNTPNFSAFLKGHVANVYPADHRIVVYIKVITGWWIKPTYGYAYEPSVDGTFNISIATGGIDPSATQVTAFLVTKNHVVKDASGLANIPISENGSDVLTSLTANR